jgi:hydroxypyruvate reductase/glycerate 2-kinase
MSLREHARSIWQAAVDAADPRSAVRAFLAAEDSLPHQALRRGGRVVVVGGGKAGAAMARGVEDALGALSGRVTGWLNVPAGDLPDAGPVRLHPARPAGSNHPTAEGVAGVEEMLRLVAGVGPADAGLVLLSGGGSALLPAPVEGVSLADKQEITRLLHASGATIDEMNCVRKHLSRVKGGRLAQAFAGRGCPVLTLLVSDVIGDPLDVIASGPTAPDPTTFADALAVLRRFGLEGRAPGPVLAHLRRGAAGEASETPKTLPPGVDNRVLCNNAGSLRAAAARAEALGYRVVNLGSFLEGETAALGVVLAGVVRAARAENAPAAAPVCLLSGGETTVTLGEGHGKGGRNQELVLATITKLGAAALANVVVLSGGTDGEDGPTDAAGAVGDAETLQRAAALGLDPSAFLARHDAYAFFEKTGGLLKTGMTQTNVMDVRVILVGREGVTA